MFAQPQRSAQRCGKETENVMLGSGAEKHALLPLDDRSFGFHKAQNSRIEVQRGGYVVDEDVRRADSGDLEGSAQQYAADVVRSDCRLCRPEAGHQIYALGSRLLDLVVLAHLRDGRSLAKAAVVHRIRPAAPLPTDLLDPVVELILVTVRIAEIDVPLSA